MSDLLLSGGLVVGADGEARPADVLVRDGAVEWVGRPGGRAAGRRADVGGATLVPGLIDLHTHPGMMGGFRNDPGGVTPERVRRDLRIFAAYGVTTVQSLGLDRDFAYAVARDRRPDEARLLSVGHGFGTPGVPPLAMDPPGPLRLTDRGAIVRALAEAKERGASGTKLWYDDWYGQHARLPEDAARTVIEESARLGLRTFAHVYRVDDAKWLVRAGVRTLAHMPRDRRADGELWALMVERGVPVIPTLTVPDANLVYLDDPAWLDSPLFTRHLEPGAVEHVRSAAFRDGLRARPEFGAYAADLANARANVRAAYEAGVRIAFGTDAGVSQRTVGFAEHRELELLAECGLTPRDILAAATVTAADVLGRPDLGAIEPGRRADIVVVRGDPLRDVRALRHIEAVYVDGEMAAGPL